MDEVAVCCFAVNKNEDLAINEVVRWLKCATDSGPENSRVISVPPAQPKGGEVYIFKPTSDAHESKFLISKQEMLLCIPRPKKC